MVPDTAITGHMKLQDWRFHYDRPYQLGRVAGWNLKGHECVEFIGFTLSFRPYPPLKAEVDCRCTKGGAQRRPPQVRGRGEWLVNLTLTSSEGRVVAIFLWQNAVR